MNSLIQSWVCDVILADAVCPRAAGFKKKKKVLFASQLKYPLTSPVICGDMPQLMFYENEIDKRQAFPPKVSSVTLP